MTGRCRLWLLAIFIFGLGGCHADQTTSLSVEAKRSAKPSVSSEVVVPSVETPLAPEPTYIDLGPFETVALASVSPPSSAPAVVLVPTVLPVPPTLDQAISPAEAVKSTQLELSSEGRANLSVEQLSGPVRDRCDPDYWGGASPPAYLGCGKLGERMPDQKRDVELRPGIYVRLNQQSTTHLASDDRIVRKVGEFDAEISDETLGAVLLVGGRGAGRTSFVVPPPVVEETGGAENPAHSDGSVPTVLLP